MSSAPLPRRGLLTAVPGLYALASGVAEQPSATARGQLRVRTGFETLAADGYAAVRGRRLGLIANQTAVLPDLRHEVDVLHRDPRVRLVAVFGPEHGFRGTAQAGGSTGDHRDPHTGLPVLDAYAKSPAALAALFTSTGVDTVGFDLQDVGTRFYTYIWTLHDALVAAARLGLRFVVLDRPNPLGGGVAGPVLDPRFASPVGRVPIALRHGMTVGELALLFNDVHVPRLAGRRAALTVLPMRGWRRRLDYAATGLPWVPPSPNMPTPRTALVYPGTGLLEGSNLSEGRGTTRPFELVGAPYLDTRFAASLRAAGLPGVRFREASFTPTFGAHRGQRVHGVQIYVIDPVRYEPVRVGVTILATARRLGAGRFAWRPAVGTAPHWIDRLAGSDQLRLAIDAGQDVGAIVAGWQTRLAAFREQRRAYLRYPDTG
jgi:uncharacterized protein YbbC (DUF1343 family)